MNDTASSKKPNPGTLVFYRMRFNAFYASTKGTLGFIDLDLNKNLKIIIKKCCYLQVLKNIATYVVLLVH